MIIMHVYMHKNKFNCVVSYSRVEVELSLQLYTTYYTKHALLTFCKAELTKLYLLNRSICGQLILCTKDKCVTR